MSDSCMVLIWEFLGLLLDSNSRPLILYYYWYSCKFLTLINCMLVSYCSKELRSGRDACSFLVHMARILMSGSFILNYS